MDVKSLYPSVPRKEARTAVKKALEERSDEETDISTILELMDLVLEHNYIQFMGKYYLQTQGTAIGSKLGNNYACTYLGEWEKKLLQIAPKKPMIFFRYIDDIFGIWSHSEEDLYQFLNLANNIHPYI